jgi:hypothetical protein
MFNESLQRLDRELNNLRKSQQEHLILLENKIAQQQAQLSGIERAVIGEPDNSHHDITNYIDKHGF